MLLIEKLTYPKSIRVSRKKPPLFRADVILGLDSLQKDEHLE